MSLLSFTKKIVSGRASTTEKQSKKTATVKKSPALIAVGTTSGKLGLTPLVTEKTVSAQSGGTTVAFRVRPSATKGQIMAAIVERYNIRPLRVRTLQNTPKTRRRGASIGKTNATKKAYVTLPAGKTIDMTV